MTTARFQTFETSSHPRLGQAFVVRDNETGRDYGFASLPGDTPAIVADLTVQAAVTIENGEGAYRWISEPIGETPVETPITNIALPEETE